MNKTATEKICGRCGNSFDCRANDIANCQCNTIRLSPKTQDFLGKTHYDCLCRNCLAHFEKFIPEVEHHELPMRQNEFIENVHFYKDNGLWVFTEWYHLLKGFCCKSGCRHCPYGYKKNDK